MQTMRRVYSFGNVHSESRWAVSDIGLDTRAAILRIPLIMVGSIGAARPDSQGQVAATSLDAPL